MFANRELATVLAALRHWQGTVTEDNPFIASDYDHFDKATAPLDSAEIDALCARLNQSVDDGRCDCERSGYFCCGVPGILAHLDNGRVAPGAMVERCDFCQRIPNDEAALAKLQALGLA